MCIASVFNQPLEKIEICPLQLLLGMTAGLDLCKDEHEKVSTLDLEQWLSLYRKN